MDKFSELKAAAMAATPGPWFRSSVQFNGITTEATFITQGNKPHVASTSEKRDAIFIAAANPDTVIALLAELEAKDKRITTLDMRNSELNSRMDRWASDRAESANRIAELEQDELAMRASSRAVHEAQENHINQQQDRIDSLEKTNAGLGRGLAAAEKRLATPVRLKKVDSSNVPFAGDGFNAAVDYCAKSVRAAGFTVEGDE